MNAFWSTLDPQARLIVEIAGVALLAVLVVAAWLAVRRARRRRGAVSRAPGRGEPERTIPPESSFDRLRRGLAKTRGGLFSGLGAILGGGSLDPAAVEELETALIRADVGVHTTERLLRAVRSRNGSDAPVRERLAGEMLAILTSTNPPSTAAATSPRVIVVAGVNGVGKTTSIGKLAARYAAEGKRVLLVAADTFRAAAIEQLGVWAERTRTELIRQQQGSDPAAVVFDGMRAALARGSDVVIVDTAGRLHTKSNLMDELKKVRRVIAREIPGAPHETLLVVDATTGQNGLAQARAFVEALQVTGIVIAIAAELGIPIRYVGIGERLDDLREFDPGQFVAALLAASEPTDSLDTQQA